MLRALRVRQIIHIKNAMVDGKIGWGRMGATARECGSLLQAPGVSSFTQLGYMWGCVLNWSATLLDVLNYWLCVALALECDTLWSMCRALYHVSYLVNAIDPAVCLKTCDLAISGLFPSAKEKLQWNVVETRDFHKARTQQVLSFKYSVSQHL